MPNQPATKNRVVRVPDDIWDGAKAVTAQTGETVTAVITRALADYIENPPTPGAYAPPAKVTCDVCGRLVGRRGGGGTEIPAVHRNPGGVLCQVK